MIILKKLNYSKNKIIIKEYLFNYELFNKLINFFNIYLI